jgi:hypothetical protein
MERATDDRFVWTDDDLERDALVADLRTSLRDDGVLATHLGHVHPVRELRAVVHVPGDFRAVTRRLIRLARISHVDALPGLSRSTCLLAYPSLFVMPLVFGAGVFGDVLD